MDWVLKAAVEISNATDVGNADAIRAIITRNLPEPPLLQCVDCRNTESCAGAMARQFNQGRCLHCGGWFKVVRA